MRRRLPDERRAITHHFSVGGQEGYLTVGVYEDGSPGEIFVRMAKEGSTISGLMDSFATVVSLALQHGVPLDLLCRKFSHTRFEPSGWTRKSENRLCHVSDGLPLQMDGAEIPQERAGRTIRDPVRRPFMPYRLPNGEGAVEDSVNWSNWEMRRPATCVVR